MQNYYKQLLLLVKRLMLLIVLMTVTRLIFYIFNYSFFATLSLNQVLLHFMYGIRFDLASVFLLNLGFIIFSTLPDSILKLKGYQLFLKIQYVAVNSILLAANLVDTKFYEFEGKRLTGDFFTKEWLGEDFITLLPEFISDFWYIFLVFIVLVYALIKFYPRNTQSAIINNKVIKYKIFKQIGFTILILLLSISIGRGGLQLRPIGIIAAARYTSPEFMALILNSPFTILKTLGGKSLPNPEYFTLNELESIYNPIHKFEQHKRFRHKNVVIIILESFGKEYSGYLNDTTGFTPKFDSIMQLGLTYKNAFANGKRSIEALPSIFSGLPALMDNAFVNSKFSSNAVEGIGSILNKQGYYTAFYHGGKNGTMGFDNYAKLVGISNYFGIDQYANEADYDGNWGVFDEPYLQYVAKEINSMQQPFFASVFTLSSHHPYKIPEQHQNKFPKGNLDNLESIGYADYALGEFFKTAAKQPWFKNTLFVLTADHTAQASNPYYKSNIGKYAVPLVFYAPGDKKMVGISEKICQQTDILPSILDYLKYSEPFVAFGNSVFSSDTNSFAVNYLSGIYQFKDKNVTIYFDGQKVLDNKYSTVDTTSIVDFFYKMDSSSTSDSFFVGDTMLDSVSIAHEDSTCIASQMRVDSLHIKQAENILKGIIQQYNYRMEHNLMKYHGKLTDIKQE